MSKKSRRKARQERERRDPSTQFERAWRTLDARNINFATDFNWWEHRLANMPPPLQWSGEGGLNVNVDPTRLLIAHICRTLGIPPRIFTGPAVDERIEDGRYVVPRLRQVYHDILGMRQLMSRPDRTADLLKEHQAWAGSQYPKLILVELQEVQGLRRSGYTFRMTTGGIEFPCQFLLIAYRGSKEVEGQTYRPTVRMAGMPVSHLDDYRDVGTIYRCPVCRARYVELGRSTVGGQLHENEVACRCGLYSAETVENRRTQRVGWHVEQWTTEHSEENPEDWVAQWNATYARLEQAAAECRRFHNRLDFAVFYNQWIWSGDLTAGLVFADWLDDPMGCPMQAAAVRALAEQGQSPDPGFPASNYPQYDLRSLPLPIQISRVDG